MTRRGSLATAACLLWTTLSAEVSSQSGASLDGVVLAADDQRTPVRRAIVVLTGPGIATNLAAVTDDRGRFEFYDLTAGRFRVTAQKAGYITTEYGAKRPGRPGTPVATSTGGRTTGLRVLLAKGAVLTGTVRTASGEPAPGVTVSLGHAGDATAVSRAVPLNSVTTDDEGSYRFFGLDPGDYLVAIVAYPSIREATRLPSTEIDRRLQMLGARHAPGTAAAAVEPAHVPPVSYAPRFYPDATSATDAERIRLAAGDVRTNVDFVMAPSISAVISGVVMTFDGSPTDQTRLSLMPTGPPTNAFRFQITNEAPASDGTFRFSRIPAGRYVLSARRSAGPNSLSADALWAVADVDVRHQPATGITLTLRPPLTASGHATFDGAEPPSSAALERLRVQMVPISDPAAGPAITPGPPATSGTAPSDARIQPDGTVVFRGLRPGHYTPVASAVPAGWWLRSVMLEGRDLLDTPLELGADSTDVAGLTLTFSDRHSELSGMLEERDGRPGTDYFVVVIPADSSLWRPGARRIRAVRPATDGHFSVADLPAGTYLVAALHDFEPNDLLDRSFLDELSRFALPIAIRDGQRTTENLRLAR